MGSGPGPVRQRTAMTATAPTRSAAGYTLIELMCAMALAATLVGISIPATQSTLDEIRVAAAARDMAARVGLARVEAVRRSSAFAYRFVPEGADYRFTAHADGNGNGVRTIEISNGVDLTLAAAQRLQDKHPGARFGLLPGLPDLDGGWGSQDGVRIGSSRILTLSPDGSATSGTLYVHGTRSQYAVRVLGGTGRTRVFRYDTGRRLWISR
jgi:prepilin-type N-terminal cleavage/methylation domain-containing protein